MIMFDRVISDIIDEPTFEGFLAKVDERMEEEALAFAREHGLDLSNQYKTMWSPGNTIDVLDQRIIRRHIYSC